MNNMKSKKKKIDKDNSTNFHSSQDLLNYFLILSKKVLYFNAALTLNPFNQFIVIFCVIDSMF